MSADGDTVREALWPAHIHEGAFAALARLEAAEENCRDAETNYLREFDRANAAEAQRDALAEALRCVCDMGDIAAVDIARAALAEAGLE